MDCLITDAFMAWLLLLSMERCNRHLWAFPAFLLFINPIKNRKITEKRCQKWCPFMDCVSDIKGNNFAGFSKGS